jgi:uncharacterized membrane-anchored protein
MSKGPKIQYDESDSGSDSEDEESSMEELMELLQEAHPLMNKKRGIQGVAQETQSS